MRLAKDDYVKVQPIYYPGFTIAGIAEPIAILAFLLLAFVTPNGAVFWLTLAAFLALCVSHLLYWVLTHPVNNFWLADFRLEGSGARFFRFDPFRRQKQSVRSLSADWTTLRDRWEYSHIARAGLTMLCLILLATAIVL
jgi:hypothetical protein